MSKTTDPWLGALEKQGLAVKSATSGLVSRGFLDSGNYALNWALSGRLLGGYPLGHTGEIFGDPSTGKSFLVARAIAMAQKADGVALLDDTEGGYNLEWIHTLGVDAEHLAYRRSHTVKEHLETARAFVKAYDSLKMDKPGILACDSISLLTTEHEMEVGLDKVSMTKAKELKAFFRIIGAELSDIPVVHISTSHTIANIGGGMYNNRTTAGGGGPKFQASFRVDLRSVSKIKDDREHVGVICRAVVVKNRITAPWKQVRLAIPFYQPLSRASGLINLLLELGALETKGQFLTYKGESLGLRAYVTKKRFLKQDEEAEKLLDQVPEILEEVDELLATRTVGRPGSLTELMDGEDEETDEEPDPEEVQV